MNSVVTLVGVTFLLLCIRSVSACNCTECNDCTCLKDCTSSAAIGLAVAFLGFFIVGLVLGGGCMIVVVKFIKWMDGKALIFTPWPRVHSSKSGKKSILNNPTYEINIPPASVENIIAKSSLKKEPDVYEEPINEAEHNLQADWGSLTCTMPYAIHDFEQIVDEPKPTAVVKSRPHFSQEMKSKNDPNSQRSWSESGKGNIDKNKRSKKPPVAKKGFTAKSSSKSSSKSNQVLPAVLESASEPGRAYSELDKKTSYATLEPYIGEVGNEDKGQQNVEKESYSQLNH